MSRAFTPPDTLSQDDIRTVADVRRAIWINGFFGLGTGSVVGMVGHIILQSLQKKYIPSVGGSSSSSSTVASKGNTSNGTSTSWIYKCLKPLPPLGKNTFLLSLLGGGALGSFLMSTTAGEWTSAIRDILPVSIISNPIELSTQRNTFFSADTRSKQCSCTASNL